MTFLVAAALLAAEPLLWNAAVESQARSRTEVFDGAHSGLGEVELRGTLGLLADDPDGRTALQWAPELLLRKDTFGASPETGNTTQQAGRLELRRRLLPGTQLAFRAGLDWGWTDFSPLSSAPAIGVGLPPTRFVRTLGLSSELELVQSFSGRLQLAVAASALRGGGVGHEAVQALPFQLEARAHAQLTWAADRQSSLSLLLGSGQSRFFSLRQIAVLSYAQASWAVRATRDLRLDAAAGLSVLRSFGDSGASQTTYPAGSLGAALEVPVGPRGALRGFLRGGLSPSIDGLTALGTETARLEGGAAASSGALTVHLDASRGYAVSGAFQGTDSLRFEGSAAFAASREWAVEGGAGAARTNQLPFAGWQSQLFVRLRWGAAGSI